MPTDTLRQIIGSFASPDGTVYANQTLTWFRERRKVTGQGSTTVLDQPFFVTTDASGAVDDEVMAGNYLVLVALSDGDRYFNVAVPDEAGPHNLADLVDTGPVDDSIVTQVQALVLLARNWAEKPEDQVVDPANYPGEYSSKHHAAKSSASATAAAGSATEASDSADAAAGSATTATTKASEASDSADAAAGSATTATTKASDASDSASAAATSETNASGAELAASFHANAASDSADAAAASETAAAGSASAAAASYDAFDDRYLGSYASDPATDNDGAPILTGALYWNTTADEMRVYDGASWAAAYAAMGANLTSLQGLTLAADKLPYATGPGTLDLTKLSSVGRTFLAATTKFWQREALELGSANKQLADLSLVEGDILFQGGSVLSRLPKGTNRQVLAMNSGATAPEWIQAGAAELISVATAAGDSAIDFTLDNSTYEVFMFKLFGVKPSISNEYLWLRVSGNGGSTFDAGTNNYATGFYEVRWAQSNIPANTDDAFVLLGGYSGGVNNNIGFTGTVEVLAAGLSEDTLCMFNGHYRNSSNLPRGIIAGVANRQAASVTDAVRFLFSSGNISSGTIALYGLRKAD